MYSSPFFRWSRAPPGAIQESDWAWQSREIWRAPWTEKCAWKARPERGPPYRFYCLPAESHLICNFDSATLKLTRRFVAMTSSDWYARCRFLSPSILKTNSATGDENVIQDGNELTDFRAPPRDRPAVRGHLRARREQLHAGGGHKGKRK